MAKLRFGQQGQVSFRDQEEYYYALGFLANSRNAELRWENNEDAGAWGSEGRIHCLVPEDRFPQCFRFTAGRGVIYARINCNDYVGTLITEHNFGYNGNSHNIEKILETVPVRYRDAFKEGYGIKIDIDPAYKPVIRRGENASSTDRSRGQSSASTQATVNTQTIVEKKPPIPIPIGTEIVHRSFGKGIVYEVDRQYLRIRFSTVGEKSFVNPDAFEKGFLSLPDVNA